MPRKALSNTAWSNAVFKQSVTAEPQFLEFITFPPPMCLQEYTGHKQHALQIHYINSGGHFYLCFF